MYSDPPPRLVKFFHFAGGFQHGLAAGDVHSGDDVMFNGASILKKQKKDGKEVLVADVDVLESLYILIMRHNVSLGL